MIADRLEHWNLYFTGAKWQRVADFLGSLGEETPEGRYEIDGDRIYAQVMSYPTREIAEGRLESHRNYIDIQAVLVGAEGIAWHPTAGLVTGEAYRAETDVEFHVPPGALPARVEVFPGYFVALFPHDAHMPQLRVTGSEPRIKKVVVKVHRSLYPGLAAEEGGQ